MAYLMAVICQKGCPTARKSGENILNIAYKLILTADPVHSSSVLNFHAGAPLCLSKLGLC